MTNKNLNTKLDAVGPDNHLNENVIKLERQIDDLSRLELEHQKNEKRLLRAQRLALLGDWVMDLRTFEQTWSVPLYEIFGVPLSTAPNYDVFKACVHPDDLQATIKRQDELVAKGKPFSSDFRIVRPDGEIRHIHAQFDFEYDEGGNPTHIIGIDQDFTESRLTELSLREAREAADIAANTLEVRVSERTRELTEEISRRKMSEESLEKTLGEFSAIMDTIDYGVLFMDADLKAIITNKALHDMWGYPDDLFDSPVTMEDIIRANRTSGIYNVAEKDFDAYIKQRTDAVREGSFGPLEMTLADGRTFQYQCIALPNGERMLTYFDLTKQKQAEEQILHLANHDALTGLPTMRLATERMHSAIALGRRHKTKIAIMFVDLDGFKNVNDTHGHAIGDLLLQEVARRFVNCLRATDTVARVGGDEFVIIQSEPMDHVAANKVAENIIKTLEAPFILEDNEVTIGASIGIAIYPEHGEDAKELIKNADKAMYEVKHSGKNNHRIASS